MDLRVVLALLSGFLMGCGFVYFCFRRGLTEQEWLYFKSFLCALRYGEYDVHDEEDEEEKEEAKE